MPSLPLDVYNAKNNAIATAHGDNATDDTAALQSLINGVPNGSSIYLPAGRYRLSAALNITAKVVRIYGDTAGLGNHGTWLIRTQDAPALVFTGATAFRREGNCIERIGIDGDPAFATDAIRALYQGNMRFDQVIVNESGGNGLYCKEVWDSVFVQVLFRKCGKHATGQAGLLLERPDTDCNNNLRFVGCVFEHCDHGPLVVSPAPVALADPLRNNQISFEACKFEASGRPAGDGSPLRFSKAARVSFSACFFSLFARADNSGGFCLQLDERCVAPSISGGFCYNTATPSGFIKLTNTISAEIEIRGYKCGGVSVNGDCREVVAEVWDEDNPLPQVGQTLVEFPPVASIDLQRIARSVNQVVDDPSAPRGRALRAATVGGGLPVFNLRLGGSGTMGITIFAKARLATGSVGGGTFAFKVTKDAATLTLAKFTPTTSYAEFYCVVPRDLVTADAMFTLANDGSNEVLLVAELGWLQGMFNDQPPVLVGAAAADPWLSRSVTFEPGEVIARRNTGYAAGECEGWGCSTGGTTTGNQLVGVTGTMASGSPNLTVSSAAGITVGTYLTVAGAIKMSRVKAISGSNITLSSNAAAATSPGAAVTYFAPVFNALGGINAVSPFATQVAKLKGITTAALSVVAGPGAGTSAPTPTITGSNVAGEISFTTGSTPPASGVIATITFSNAYITAPFVSISPSNAPAARLGSAQPFVTTTGSSFSLNASAALAVATHYKFYYHVVQ